MSHQISVDHILTSSISKQKGSTYRCRCPPINHDTFQVMLVHYTHHNPDQNKQNTDFLKCKRMHLYFQQYADIQSECM